MASVCGCQENSKEIDGLVLAIPLLQFAAEGTRRRIGKKRKAKR
jgi:hypothetical protein